jgi:CheY-like chemotaxis protein
MATILVVDDDSVIRELLAVVLEEESEHNVVLAANGKEALDRLNETPVDAIVCDVNMPVMDGLELVRAIRSDPALRQLPVLMISAVLEAEELDPELEVDLMLEKPFEITALLACVGFVLRRVRAGKRRVTVSRRRAAASVERLVQSARPRLRPRPGYSRSSIP